MAYHENEFSPVQAGIATKLAQDRPDKMDELHIWNAQIDALSQVNNIMESTQVIHPDILARLITFRMRLLIQLEHSLKHNQS